MVALRKVIDYIELDSLRLSRLTVTPYNRRRRRRKRVTPLECYL